MNEAMERLKQRQTASGTSYDPLDAIMAAAGPNGKVIELPIRQLLPFEGHTFKVRPMDSEYMVALLDSIGKNGVLEPLIVRPSKRIPGSYEIIAGHTRRLLAEKAGLLSVPCCIRNLDDDQATIQMGESNLQRPDWLPSEKAFTYKAHLEAVQRMRGEVELSSTQVTGKSRDEAARRWGITGKMLSAYVRLAGLSPKLLSMVDEGRITVKGGYELSFLPEDNQEYLILLMEEYPKARIDETQAAAIRAAEFADYKELLGLSEGGGRKRAAGAWKLSIPKALLPEDAKEYLKEPDLQERIAGLITEYVNRRKAATD